MIRLRKGRFAPAGIAGTSPDVDASVFFGPTRWNMRIFSSKSDGFVAAAIAVSKVTV